MSQCKINGIVLEQDKFVKLSRKYILLRNIQFIGLYRTIFQPHLDYC